MRNKKWNLDGGFSAVTEYIEESGERGRQIQFWIEIHDEGVPAVRLTRTFRLPGQPRESRRHDLRSELVIENLSEQSHRVIVTYGGGLGVRRASSQRDDRVIDIGLRLGDGRFDGDRKMVGEIAKSGSVVLYGPSAAEAGTRFSWAATANKYFTCTIAPFSHAGKDQPAYLADVSAVDADGLSTTDDVTLRFVTRAETIAAGRSLTYGSDLYLGEKDGDGFQSVPDYKDRNYYYQIAKEFGWCTFTWLVELMIWLLNSVYRIVPNYGVAIIILVLIVRTMLHPITKKGQINMVRMQQRMGDLGPKMENLKKKFANDKARLQQETMKLYRDSGINPATQFLGCLPMVIQMPIWVALYLSLSNNIHMRHQPFFGWIQDMTAPDALYTFASPITIPIVGWTLPAFNLLPFLMAVSMYFQQKLQPKPKPNPNATQQQRDQQEMMQKMMPMMSIMMLIFFYKMPSGLNLYIGASSLFGTLEQWRIRKHIKQHEEDGTLEPTPPKKQATPAPPERRQAPGWFARLQKKVEEAQKMQRTQRAKPKR